MQTTSGNPAQQAKTVPAASAETGLQQMWAIAALIIVLGIVAAIRIRLLDFPLERDEGEFGYGAQLLMQGVSPYDAAYTLGLKLPGATVAYAFIMAIFGQTAAGIHSGLLLANVAATAFMFVIAKRIYGDTAGAVAAGTYALLSIIPETNGLAAHATHFVVLFALAGIALLVGLDERTPNRHVFYAGLLLGVSFLMKQTGAVFGLFAAAWIVWNEFQTGRKSWPRLAGRLGSLLAGGLAPVLLTFLLIARAGDFRQFWFWAVTYASAYGGIIGWQNGLISMSANIRSQFAAAPGLWGMALLGLPFLLWHAPLRRWRFFIAPFAGLSFLAVCPGGYFRGHYFIQLMPAAGLLAGAAFRGISDWWAGLKVSLLPAPAIVFAAIGAASLIAWSGVFFQLSPDDACRAVYGLNPFPEAVEISHYIETHSPADARMAVLGSEPEMFFYAHRRSATGHVLTYPLMEPQPYAATMRTEMIHEIDQAGPQYVVYVNIPFSWVHTTAGMDRALIKWFEQYQRQQLQMVGRVDLFPDQPTRYDWSTNQQFSLQSTNDLWLAVFKRR